MFHLRFTPNDISGYTFDFLQVYDRYIIAFENKDKEGKPCPDHYHILIDADYTKKSLSNAVITALKIPKSTRGKNNKYYSLMDNWEDPSYICKYDDIRKSKGFTEKQILDFAIEGKKKYLEKGLIAKNLSVSSPKSPPKVPYQQAVIADAGADWYNYKRLCADTNEEVDKTKICEFVCDAMSKNGKGINQYLVKELAYVILYNDLDYKGYVLSRIKSCFNS